MFNRQKFLVGVDYKGQVCYYAAGKSTTTCQLDMTYFPFDSQVCYIELNRLEFGTQTKLPVLVLKIGMCVYIVFLTF